MQRNKKTATAPVANKSQCSLRRGKRNFGYSGLMIGTRMCRYEKNMFVQDISHQPMRLSRIVTDRSVYAETSGQKNNCPFRNGQLTDVPTE